MCNDHNSSNYTMINKLVGVYVIVQQGEANMFPFGVVGDSFLYHSKYTVALISTFVFIYFSQWLM